MYRKLSCKTAAALLLTLVTGAASAQFVWIDAKGVRQYSDQPPPASVPKSRILKNPGMELRNSKPEPAAPVAPDSAKTETGTTTAPAIPQTTAEKNADYLKRKSEQADKDKKVADDARDAAAAAKNCDRVRAYARSLQSGERIASIDKNNERSYLSDEKRTQEIADSRRALDNCK